MLASVKFEHLGGDSINFAATTKVMASVNGGDSVLRLKLMALAILRVLVMSRNSI